MKAAALVAVALGLCVALPGPIQAKQKSTFCVGKDGKNYGVGDSYVDNEGEACIRYKCVKRKGKFIMKKEKCDCNGGNHGISCCPNYVRGDMVGGSEIKITFSPNTENGCQNSCKVQHPTSIGVTQDHDGTSSCYCEFGSPIVGGSANVYKTCLFSTATSGVLKTIKRRTAATTTTTTSPTTTITSSTSTMTTLTTTKADSIYFIAGGNGALRDIELYYPTIANLPCSMSPPPLNNNWLYHTTFYYNNTIHLYGGTNTASTCISYNINMEEWKTHTLTTSRKWGHSSVVLKKRVFIIGGKDASGNNYVGAESTPLPLTDQPVLTPVLNLDYKGVAQCTTKVDEDTLVVTGGYYYGYLSSVIEYNAKTRTTTSLPSMIQPRYQHGCAAVEMDNTKYIIVAGGYNSADAVLETTEMLQMGGSSWTPLDNLNVARYGHSIVVTQSGVMAIGGYDGSRGYLSTVELLDWSAKSWRIVQPSLSKSRGYFGGAVEIPASMFRCQVCPPLPLPQNGDWVCDFDNHNCHLQCDAGLTSSISTVRCQNGVWDQGTDNAKCTESFSSDSVYFVAGGRDDQKMYYDTELYSPTIENLQCSITLPKIDRSIRHWLGHYNFYHNNTIYSCGPDNTGLICMSYSSQMRDWKTYKVTPGRRDVSGVILEDTLYLIGGSHEWPEPTSTKLPLSEQSIWSKVPNLNFKGSAQCVAKIDEESLVITGGINYGSRKVADVKQYNTKTSVETSLSPMSQHRFTHGCIVVERDNKKWLIVSGGHNDSMHLQSTEMLQLLRENSSWISLGNLNWKRAYLGMAETVRGVMVLGGNDKTESLKSVELLDWATKRWKVVQPSLKKGRNRFGGALKIPASMFNCQAAVDGEWSAWSKFTACSATCGNTTKTRNRACSNPSPSNGGKPCPGLDEEVVSCGLSPCGFNMSATCDDVMWLFADGDLLVNNSSDWRVTSEVHIPACTKVIEIHCLDSWIHGGILASSDNGLITDGAWNCSSDNRTTWNPAYLLGRNGRTAPDISPEAVWIWTDMSHWMQTDHRRHTKAICKIELETSQCPEPPVCPPFGELTPTTISTPTPAPTTTTTLTTSKPKPGFNLTATCDNEMKLFVDGNLLATSSNWRDTSKVNIPANTEAIEIHCMATGTVGGILASSDNGLLTDGSWNCSSDNGTTWNPAYEVGPNSGAVPDISPEAEWIWTGCIGDWTSKYTGEKHKKNIICKIDLKPVIDGGWSTWRPFSQCSATCAEATKARTRTCSQPSPDNGGEPCLGLEEEVVSCGLSPCGEDSCPYTDKYMDCPQWKDHCESGQWQKCVKENCPKTCNCTGSDSVYFLAGGHLHDVKYEIELYHPTMKNLSCSISVPSLDDRKWHTTFYFSNTVYLCGGYNTESTCISYNSNMNGWKTHALTTSRWKGHTSVVLNNRLYLIGGHNSTNTGRLLDSESTPLPLTDQPVLTPVPNLNYKALSPCTAKIDEDTLVVTGGGHYNGYLSTAIQYNVKTSTYTSLPSLKQSRSRHGCVVVKMKNTKWIIVSGGNGIKGNVISPLQSTEMLQLDGRSWIQLGNLNEARQVHSMVATVRGILVMGGEGANGKDLSTVELLDLSIKQWSVIEPSLKTPRLSFGGAVEIPARMFDCTDTTSTTSTTNVTTTTTTTSTIVVTGGAGARVKLATSEVIGPEGVCSGGIPPLPVALELHASVFFNNQLMVCGGYTNTYQKKCYFLKDAASKSWMEGPSLNIPRAWFTLTKVGDEVFAVGGEGFGGDLDTIEKLSGNPAQWKILDKKMSTIRELHCTVYWEKNNSLVVIGGNSLVNIAQSFNLKTGVWSDLPQLPVLRELACSVYEDSIVVTGGWEHASKQDNLKIYVYKEGNWETIGEMDGLRRYHTMDVLDGKLLVIGGTGRDGIEQIRSNGTVETLNFSLSGIREKHSAAKVPAGKFPCFH